MFMSNNCVPQSVTTVDNSCCLRALKGQSNSEVLASREQSGGGHVLPCEEYLVCPLYPILGRCPTAGLPLSPWSAVWMAPSGQPCVLVPVRCLLPCEGSVTTVTEVITLLHRSCDVFPISLFRARNRDSKVPAQVLGVCLLSPPSVPGEDTLQSLHPMPVLSSFWTCHRSFLSHSPAAVQAAEW